MIKSLPGISQVKICFNKFWITYWRTPEYNGTRFSFTVGVALLFGAIFWKLGGKMWVSCDNSTLLTGLFGVF